MREEDVAVPVKKNLGKRTTVYYSDSLKYAGPQIDRRSIQSDRPDDNLDAVRGILMGILLSIPIWILILFLIFK